MAFENSQAFTVENKKIILSDQFESVCRLDVPNEKPVRNILSINTFVRITGQEKVADGINFSGNTYYQISYQTEEGEISNVSAVTDWKEKTGAVENDNFALIPRVKENVVTSQSYQEIVISTLIDIDVVAINSEKLSPVIGLSDDYVSLEGVHTCQKAVNFVKENFNEVSEMQIGGKVDQVLNYFGNAIIKNVVAGIDSVTVEGEAYVNTVLLINGEIVNQIKTVEFKHETAVLSTVPNNVVDASVELNWINVTASVSEIDSNSNLIYSLDFSENIAVYSNENISLVEDLFSTKHEVACQYECVESKVLENEQYLQDSQVLTCVSDKEFYDIVCITSAETQITGITKTENGSVINGVVVFDTILKDQSGEMMPFKGYAPFAVDSENVDADDVMDAECKILSYKAKSQKELSLTAEIDIVVKKYKNEYIPFVNSVEELEDKIQNNAAVKVYVTGEEETLFNVAKAVNVKPEEIIRQNPQAQDNLETRTRLVIYYPLDIKF